MSPRTLLLRQPALLAATLILTAAAGLARSEPPADSAQAPVRVVRRVMSAPGADPAGGPVRVVRRTLGAPGGEGADAHPASGALAPPRAVEFPGARVEAPIVLVEGRPVVDAMLDGRGPFRLGIETGAAFTGLTRRTLDSLHASPVRHDEAGEIDSLGTMAIGGATFREVAVRDAAPADPRIDGFIGLGAFEALLLTIDYPAKRLVLERAALPEPDGRTVFAVTRVGPFWALALDVAGHRLPAVIDTRGSGAFGVTPVVGDSLAFLAPPIVIGQARGAGIPLTDVKLGRLAGDIRCGAIRFERPLVTVRALPPGFPDALLGSETLAHFAFSLDQRTSRARLLAPAPGPIPAPPPLTDLGLRLRQQPGGAPEVGEVRAGTPADSLGIRPGDSVLEAGGLAGADIEPGRWRALASTGRPVELKLRRGDRTLDLLVAPAILVR